MQQNESSHWNHKIGAVALIALITLFLVYAQYTGGWGRLAGWGVRPAPSAVSK